MLDGARNALLGYLFQLLGTAAVVVREVATESGSGAELITGVGERELRIEEFGQDATARPIASPSSDVTAIQFKYSTAGTEIGRSELIDILAAFDRSRHEAAASGVAIEHFAIMTNRRLDTASQAIVANWENSTPHSSLTLRTGKYGQTAPTVAKRLAPYGGDRDQAARMWHQVVQALTVQEGMVFDAELHRLRRFASRYGVVDSEWGGCLNRLIGALVRDTTEGRKVEVTREWLKVHLFGDAGATNLCFNSTEEPHISSICRTRLDHRMQLQHRICSEFYLEREVQQQLHSMLAQYSVVFVVGGGGCGKSLAVTNYLHSIADRQLVWSEGAAGANVNALVSSVTVARLPSRQGSTDRTLEDVRARLSVANGSSRPLWTIDVDGIDEAPEQAHQLRELINICWANGDPKASPASIVISTRSTTGRFIEEELKAQWFDTPEPDLICGVGFISLGDFLDDELLDAALRLNGRPERRIVQTLSMDATTSRHYEDPIANELLQTLRHPVVWGGYASLSESDRSGVLDLDKARLDRLAKLLLDRFTRRCRLRRLLCDEQVLDRALRLIARATTDQRRFTPIEWDQACVTCLIESDARILYRECLTYGLIERDGWDWRWRHHFLVAYLSTSN